ncbi:MAG: 2-oxoacid:ferredoxin oxidoreductase subunit beta, partial [Candidatus Hodarchaeota archaeon]
MNKKFYPYIRPERFPHRLCSGCGHGIIQGALIRAISELELSMNELVLVAGIGCAANVVNMYIKADTVHV